MMFGLYLPLTLKGQYAFIKALNLSLANVREQKRRQIHVEFHQKVIRPKVTTLIVTVL